MFAKHIIVTTVDKTTAEHNNVTQLYTVGTQLIIVSEDDNRSYTTSRYTITNLMRMEVEF